MYLVLNVPGVGLVFYEVPSPHHMSVAGQHSDEMLVKTENYPQLLLDATAVATLEEAARGVSDPGVRAALQGGVDEAVKALQKRAGSFITIKLGLPPGATRAAA
jgi:hypothetical protein